MKLTVEIDDEILANAMKLTGETKKSPALAKAATEYVKREMVKKFATMVMEGQFEDYPMTNDELEAVDR
jgi:Arc/MetJ family transcription regulator